MSENVMNLCVLFYYQWKALAAGYPLLYWDWYRSATQKDVNQLDAEMGWNFHSGQRHYTFLEGHNVHDLSVLPYFQSVKQEVLSTGLMSPETFMQFVVQKAADYMQCEKVRKMKSSGRTCFGMQSNSPVTTEHIQVLIL